MNRKKGNIAFCILCKLFKNSLHYKEILCNGYGFIFQIMHGLSCD